MTALTAAYDAKRRDGKLVSQPVAAATKINKGALVVVTATGGLAPASDTAGVLFAGVAYETVDNTAGVLGAKANRVQKDGVYRYNSVGAVATDVGKNVFVVDDNTVKTAATTNNIVAGVCTNVISATSIDVRIDNKVA